MLKINPKIKINTTNIATIFPAKFILNFGSISSSVFDIFRHNYSNITFFISQASNYGNTKKE